MTQKLKWPKSFQRRLSKREREQDDDDCQKKELEWDRKMLLSGSSGRGDGMNNSRREDEMETGK